MDSCWILPLFMVGLGVGGWVRDMQWRRATGRTFDQARQERERELHYSRFGE